MSDSPQQHAQEILNEPTTGVDSGRSEPSAPKSGVEGQVQERRLEEAHKEHPNVSEEEKAGTSTIPPTDKAEDNTVDVKEKPKVIDTIETENDGGQEGPRESADHAETDNIAEKDARAETVQASTSNEPVASNISADPSPAVSLTALRPLSPSSRTSTPPLTATSTAPAAKKFSSINVNKKFLSKTGSPSPSGPAGPTKLNPSAGKSLEQLSVECWLTYQVVLSALLYPLPLPRLDYSRQHSRPSRANPQYLPNHQLHQPQAHHGPRRLYHLPTPRHQACSKQEPTSEARRSYRQHQWVKGKAYPQVNQHGELSTMAGVEDQEWACPEISRLRVKWQKVSFAPRICCIR